MERKLITLLTKITEKTGSMKDYIVEQGTKDIWTYPKVEQRNCGMLAVICVIRYVNTKRGSGILV